MAKKDERFLNITLQNQEEKSEEIIISFSAFMNALKKFLIFWLVAAIIVGILIPVFFAVFTADQHKNLRAVVGFNYNGIEQGLAPDQSKFDVNTLKNPSVIEQTLTDLGLPLTSLEGIRQGITIEGITPTNVVDRFTVYKSAYESGNISAADKILETTYFPTQYVVTFNYAASELTGNQPVEFFNQMLNNYNNYFFETYGFNQALGSAVTALDYKSYDYPEQVDIFDSSLSSLQSYITNLSKEDTTRFRSTTTGYTFSDLSQAIQTIRDVDLNLLSANILQNNLTKDKDTLVNYYTRTIENYAKEAATYEEQLKAINEAIANYQMSTMIIYGEGGESAEYQQTSDAYDELVNQKVSVQRSLSAKQEMLKEYQKRLNLMKTQPVGSQEAIDRIEADLDALSAKLNDLINKTNATANDYYETVYLSNAYQVLAPATSSGMTTTKSVLSSSLEPLVIAEALFFVIYFGYSFCYSLIMENRKRKALENGTDSDDDDDADEDVKPADTSADSAENEEEAKSDSEDSKKKKKKA